MKSDYEIGYHRPWVAGYQVSIIDSLARYTITEAATKVGKTASHIIWLFEEALKGKEGQNFWWVAPVYGQAEIAFRRMRAQVTDKTFFRANESKLYLQMPHGPTIWFKTAEKPDNLYGEDVYAAVFDEFTRAREEAWYALRSTLTATKGKCKFIGNVRGKNNWGYRLAQKAKMKTDPLYEYHKLTAWDAVAEGVLEEEEILQAQKDLPETVFKELYLAEPSDSNTNPFGESYIRQCIFPLGAGPAVCYGIDLAKSVDWTVIIGLDQFGGVCYFDRFQKPWLDTIRAIEMLPGAGTAWILMDSTGVGDPILETVQVKIRRAEGYKYSQNTKQDLMQGLQLAIQKREITYPDGPIVSELDVFEFKYTPSGVKYTAPDGFTDDCVNSLALARWIFMSKGLYRGRSGRRYSVS